MCSSKKFVEFVFHLVLFYSYCMSQEQRCRRVPDFFYNVNLGAPIFDQSVYTTVDLSVAVAKHTEVFRFRVESRKNYIPWSFLTTSYFFDDDDLIPSDIQVSSSDSNFVVTSSNDTLYALKTATWPLSYFQPSNRYLFKLIAKQTFKNGPPIIATSIVQIYLKNANLYPPVFIGNKVFYISETAEKNDIFGTVYATDPDNDTITFTTNSTLFHVDPETGVLQLERELNLFSESKYVVHIFARDNGESCSSEPNCVKKKASTTINITVVTVNKNPPEFLKGICTRKLSIPENSPVGTVVAKIVVFDNDRGENGLINISFPSRKSVTTVSGSHNIAYRQFYLEELEQDGDTRIALLKTNKMFDFEDPNQTRIWDLLVLATDNGEPQKHKLCPLRINLIDLDDNQPEFLMKKWNFVIYPRMINGRDHPSLPLLANDADTGSNGIIEYHMENLCKPYFQLNYTTGIMSIRSHTKIKHFNITEFPKKCEVYAKNPGSKRSNMRGRAIVHIVLRGGDDKPAAEWCNKMYEELHITIPEKFYERHQTKAIYDTFAGFNGSIFYKLNSETSAIMTIKSPFWHNTNIPFQERQYSVNRPIFESQISVTRGLDTEIQDFYLLYMCVLVDPPLIGSIKIRLKDENDHIPTFDIRSIVSTVVENERGYRTIAQAIAFDRDIDPKNNKIEYSLNERLTSNSAKKKFYVESNGTVWTNATFHWNETKVPYRLFVRAFNCEPSWNSKEISSQDFQIDVRVISNNNALLVFENVNETIPISETTNIGDVILNISITYNNPQIRLNVGILSGNVQNRFAFILSSNNSNNKTRDRYEAIAQLKLVAPLDFASMSKYNLILFAYDGKILVQRHLTIVLYSSNAKAPVLLPSVVTSYESEVQVNTQYPYVPAIDIQAYDPDDPNAILQYTIYNTDYQLNLTSLDIKSFNNHATIRIKSPGLSHLSSFGNSAYYFSIRVAKAHRPDISSYVPISIKLIDKNYRPPLRITFPLIINEGMNQKTQIIFKDDDNWDINKTIISKISYIFPPEFKISGPKSHEQKNVYELLYHGNLNRTINKNLTITLQTNDPNGYNQEIRFPIIIGDVPDKNSISDGKKTIQVIYTSGYEKSLINIDLGSIYVKDIDDWFRNHRTYVIESVRPNHDFCIVDGFLRSKTSLYPGTYRIHVNVNKSNPISSASSKIHLSVESIDMEYVRQASIIRIQGEYPETLIDPTLSNQLEKLRNAIANALQVNVNQIKILSIRSVFQYRNPLDLPKPFDDEKNEQLVDVHFYVLNMKKFNVDKILKRKIDSFQSHFQIKAVSIGPNPCNNYICPLGTLCRATRTIHSKPFTIDSNLTSFVGVSILESADCVNETFMNSRNKSNLCSINSFNYLNHRCEILGLTFQHETQGYAMYNGTEISIIAPARFSIEFCTESINSDGLILYFGEKDPSKNDFWMLIEIHQSNLRFRYRNKSYIPHELQLRVGIWYRIELQFLDSYLLLSINDYQCRLQSINNIVNSYDPSTIKLYVGGLPPNSSLTSMLYPSSNRTNRFNGCIRNILSNGYYLDMSKYISSSNTERGDCRCSVTNSRSVVKARRMDIIIPWYTWFIVIISLLLLWAIILSILLIFIRKRQMLRSLAKIYRDNKKENIMDYRENCGEEDHGTYNLRVLKKPVYIIPDGNIIPYDPQLDRNDPRYFYRPSLHDYIQKKIDDQIIPYANDTKLHFQYEGEGSIASDLSPIESLSLQDDNYYRFTDASPKLNHSNLNDVDYNNHT